VWMFVYFWSDAVWLLYIFFFQAEDGIRDLTVTGVQTCALPIFPTRRSNRSRSARRPRDEQRHHAGAALARGGAPQSRRGARVSRSEERRVGKECRSRWSPDR